MLWWPDMPPADTSGPARREIFQQEALPHLDHLYTVALHLARNRNDAQDLVQDWRRAGRQARAVMERLFYG